MLNYIINKINNFKSKLSIKSGTFILILTLYFGFILNLAFWKYVFLHVSINSFTVFVFSISLLFFIAFPLFLLFNLITIPKIGKFLIILLLLISSGTNFFMFNYGAHIDSDMIRNVFETNQREAFDLFTLKAILYISITGILPSVIIVFTKINYNNLLKEIKTRSIGILIFTLIIGLFTATSYKEYASFGRNNSQVRKLINTFNYNYATVRYLKRQALAKRKFQKLDETATITPYKDDYKTVLIMVIGETARAQNFSLNGYEKETNPLLKQEDVVNFNKVKSCGTATAISLPCIFSSSTRKEFNVVDSKYTENLVDLLQKSGYDILWLENDDGCKGICSRVKHEEMVKTKNQKYCEDKYCKDEILVYDLEERLKKVDKDTVIVLHMMGSHGPTYYKRYTKDFEKFTPTCDTAEIQNCSREEIVNTYDNTIVYTDYILSSVINTLKKFPQFESGMLYISDHGESLGENNIYLHGLPYSIAPEEQTSVPMIVWMSETMKKYDYIDYNCLKNEAKNGTYSHDNIFHSIIGLLEIKTTEYKKEYDVFRKCRTETLPYQH